MSALCKSIALRRHKNTKPSMHIFYFTVELITHVKNDKAAIFVTHTAAA